MTAVTQSKILLAIGLTVAIGLTLAATPMVKAESMLHRSTAGEPDTLDPQKTFGATTVVLGLDLFEGLMTYDADGSLIMGAAKSKTMSEDGRTYTFELHENLKWSDGTPISSEHFVYTFRRLFTPETGSIYAPMYFFIENARALYEGDVSFDELGVQAIDDSTVQFTLAVPTPYFPKMLGTSSGAPMPRHVIEAYGAQWTRPQTMVSNGAYRLTRRLPNDFIEVEKNPFYRGADDVRIDAVRYYPTSDHSTSFKRFRAGEIQVALSFPPNQIEWVRQNMADSLRLSPRLASVFLAFNNNVKPFDDVRVRKALSLAIDRETIVDRVLNTEMKAAYGIVPPQIANYDGQADPSLKLPLDERLEEARRLLDEAGFGAAGQPAKITLSVFSQGEQQKTAIALQNMWSSIGVETDILTVEFRDYIRQRKTGDFEVTISLQYAAFDDPIMFLNQFESRFIRTANNPARYSNPDYDALVLEGNQHLDPDRRRALLEQAERVMLADHPAAPLYHLTERRLVSPRVKGWIATPLSFNLTRHLWLED